MSEKYAEVWPANVIGQGIGSRHAQFRFRRPPLDHHATLMIRNNKNNVFRIFRKIDTCETAQAKDHSKVETASNIRQIRKELVFPSLDDWIISPGRVNLELTASG